MRLKNTYITLLIIAGILGLSIAYAALASQTLILDGTATVATDNTNFNLEFVNGNKTYDKSIYGTVPVCTFDTAQSSPLINGSFSFINEDSISLVVSNMTTKGDTACFKLPIINTSPANSGLKAQIDINTSNSNEQWFDVSYDEEYTFGNAPYISPTKYMLLNVSITLKKTPISDSDVSYVNSNNSFVITVNGSPVSEYY